jgi:hypothetical protein
MLVNPAGETFFLYDVPLLAMWKQQDHYIVVKHRNSSDKKAIGYHAGEILGTLDHRGSEVKISLFFGPVSQDMECDSSNGQLKNVLFTRFYYLSAEDLEICLKTFDLMRRTRSQFNELMHVGRGLTRFARRDTFVPEDT